MNELGMVVDLSHCGRETTLDAVSVSEKPVAYTHTFCKALADHDRGKSDEELERLRENDGYVGVLAVPFFLEPGIDDANFETFFDHIDRMVEIVGIDRVGIGTDWGSWTSEIPEPLHEGIMESFSKAGFRKEHGLDIGIGYGPMDRYEDWSVIPERLAKRGYDAEQRRKILGENVLDFWDRAIA
jgi:membrane dipeptidase